MQPLLELLKRYAEDHTFDSGDPENRTVPDQLFCAYQDSHETDPPEIKDGFKELDTYLRQLSLDDNNAVWNLCCRLCSAYEHKAFIDSFHYGAQLMMELKMKGYYYDKFGIHIRGGVFHCLFLGIVRNSEEVFITGFSLTF